GLQPEGLEDVGLEQGLADGVEFGLELVDVGMQAAVKDVGGRAELQLREQPAAESFRLVAKPVLGAARDAAQGEVELLHAETDGAGKALGQQQKLGDQGGLHLGSVKRLVGVPGAAGA